MLIRLKISGRVVSVSENEASRLVAGGFAEIVIPPTNPKENALRKGKREKR